MPKIVTVTASNVDAHLLEEQARAIAEINAWLIAGEERERWIDALEGLENLIAELQRSAR